MAETEHAQSPDTVAESAEQNSTAGTQSEGMEGGDNSKPAGPGKEGEQKLPLPGAAGGRTPGGAKRQAP